MKIQYHNSLNVAHKVIKSLNKLVENTKIHRNSTVNPQYNYNKPTFLAKEIGLEKPVRKKTTTTKRTTTPRKPRK